MIHLFNKILQTKIIVSLIIFTSFCQFTKAQVTGDVTVEPNSIYRYEYNSGGSLVGNPIWVITGGSQVTSGSIGNIFHVDVQWGGVGTGTVTFKDRKTVLGTLTNIVIAVAPPPPAGISSDQNYVHTTTPKIATTNVSSLSNTDKIESITYFDGLGRAMQSVGIRAGGNGEDIITHVGYDEYGRQAKEYLPYTSSASIASFRTNGLGDTNSYYDAAKYEADFPSVSVSNINAYSEKEFEASPLSRVLKQAAPGKDWKLGNGHEIEFNYQTNHSTEVRFYDVSLTFANNTYTPTLQGGTTYFSAGTLYKTVTKDENHDGTSTKNHTTEEFKDKQGRVILKRTYNNSVAHDTYYVYDKFGNLSYVLPPKAEPQTTKPDATELSELCYQYKYDYRSRLVEKKIPGKGWEYIVYNKLDQPIMTQDANLDTQNKWLFTKYDAFGRVAYTGLINSGSSRILLQTAADSVSLTYVTKVTSSTTLAGTTIYYNNNGYPTTNITEIHTINYYDNYTFDKISGNSETAYGITPETNVKGLATGSKVRVLGTSDWITTVTYYDDKSRPIYVYSFNDYLNTTDKVKSKLDFTGTVDEITTTHAKTGQSTITTIDYFIYDDAGRLIEQSQKIDNKISRRLVKNNYDDLGQLESKFIDNGTQDGYKDLVGVSVLNDEITKTGSNNNWNHGFATNGSFTADGYVEYEMPQTNKALMVGLSTDNSSPSYNTIDYAIYTYSDGNVYIYESGSSKGYKTTYQTGDVFTIERIGSTINYLKNGEIFYTSLTASSGSLIGDGSIYHTSGKIKNLKTVDNSKGIQNVDYTYNVRGWLKQINNPTTLGSDLFSFKINYNTNNHGGTNLFNGNIAETEWKSANPDNSLKWYRYTYDALNRITSGIDNTTNQDYKLQSIAYDKNGNITSLIRSGHTVANPVAGTSSHFGTMDNLVYTYETKSNRLKKVLDNGNDTYGFKDGSNITTEYTYDANGNMISDANKGITSIGYNHLNLPTYIVNPYQYKSLNYIYDATGQKLEKKYSGMGMSTVTTHYAGNYVYENNKLKFFNHPEGYAEPKDENNLSLGFNYIYQYKDHLGNVRLSYKDSNNNGSVTSSEILEENNYYPFGLKHKGYNNVPLTNHTYELFQGQERTEDLGLNVDEWKYRWSDPAIGRFWQIDPLAEDYVYNGTYNFAENRVIDGYELEGLEWVDVDENGEEYTVYDPNFENEDGTKGKYHDNATTTHKNLGRALNKTEAGKEQFGTLVNSDHPITVTLDKDSEVTYSSSGIPEMGKNNNTKVETDFKTGVVVVKESKIVIYDKAVKAMLKLTEEWNVPATDDGKGETFNDLNYTDLIGVSFGHEIHHTTSANSTLKMQKGERASEAAAQKVGARIIGQLKNKKKN